MEKLPGLAWMCFRVSRSKKETALCSVAVLRSVLSASVRVPSIPHLFLSAQLPSRAQFVEAELLVAFIIPGNSVLCWPQVPSHKPLLALSFVIFRSSLGVTVSCCYTVSWKLILPSLISLWTLDLHDLVYPLLPAFISAVCYKCLLFLWLYHSDPWLSLLASSSIPHSHLKNPYLIHTLYPFEYPSLASLLPSHSQTLYSCSLCLSLLHLFCHISFSTVNFFLWLSFLDVTVH